jgi:hypothetical protein
VVLNIGTVATSLLIGGVILGARVVADKEYAWWGRLAADRVYRLASSIAAPRAAEWRSLLGERQSQLGIPCLLFALDLLLASARMRMAHVMEKLGHTCWPIRGLLIVVLVGEATAVWSVSMGLRYVAWGENTWVTDVGIFVAAVMIFYDFWVGAYAWRLVTVEWLCWRLDQTNPMLDEDEAIADVAPSLWTRSEAHALLAIRQSFGSHTDGTPERSAWRPLNRYVLLRKR